MGPQIFSGVLIAAHMVMVLVVLAQGLIMFLGWEDPREGDKRPPQNTALGRSFRVAFADDGLGITHEKRKAKAAPTFPGVRPRGGKSEFNIGAIYDDKDDDENDDEQQASAGAETSFNPLYFQNKRPKREEVEEEPLQQLEERRDQDQRSGGLSGHAAGVERNQRWSNTRFNAIGDRPATARKPYGLY